MFQFIHAADIHLDSPLRGLETHEDAPVREIRAACRRAFDNLIEMAIDEEVNFVLLAGDVYDGDWRDYNTGLFFVDRMARLMRAGIQVFMISGNHDAASQISKSLQLPDNVKVLSTKTPETILLNDLGVAIHGQGYNSRAVKENLAAQYPSALPNYYNIGLLHTALTGRAGHEPYAPCSVDDLLARGYDYWALGHVHQSEIIHQAPYVVFSGNLQGRHIRETGPKGAILVTVDDGVMSLEQRELDVVRWSLCPLNVAECREVDEVYELIRTAFSDISTTGLAADHIMAVRLQLLGETSLHTDLRANLAHVIEECRALAVAAGIWLEKVKFATSRPSTLTVDHDSPLALLFQKIDSFETDGEHLLELVPELAALRNRLPTALIDAQKFSLNNENNVAELLTDVKELLLSRLLNPGVKQ